MQDNTEEIKPSANGSTYKAIGIFEGVPLESEEVETAEINTDHFDDAEILEEIHENFEEGKKGESEPEFVKSEDVRKEELKEKGKDIKKKFVKMLNPKTVVGFADMILSRVGPMAMHKTDRNNWKLDAEEKEFLCEAFDVTVEEEGIEFWPAKVWLILGLIFFYGMKTWENYRSYYTRNVIADKQKQIDEFESVRAATQIEIENLQKEVELLEMKAVLEAKKITAEQAIKTGVMPSDIRNMSKSVDAVAILKRQFPPDLYVWEGDELQYNKDKSPKKKTGPKANTVKQHPVTKVFISDAEYQKLKDLGEIKEDENEFVKTEEV